MDSLKNKVTDSDDTIIVSDDEDNKNTESTISTETECRSKAIRMVDSMLPRELVWYYKQLECEKLNEKLKLFIFATDNPNSTTIGSKKYAVASLAKIYEYMRRRKAERRNVYEVMRVNVPSKLYVDIDVSLEQFPDFNPEKVEEVFERDLRKFLSEQVHPEFKDSKTTPLLRYDSSRKDKWSRHYILTGSMFLNNFHVGAIMRRFRSYIINFYGNPDDPVNENPYFIPPRDKSICIDGYKKEYIIDMGVYTRMRVFRLPGNRKYGKPNVLVPAPLFFTLEESLKLQNTYFPTINELRKALVQDPILALKCKIHSVKEENGSAPGSFSVHRIQVCSSSEPRNTNKSSSGNISKMKDPTTFYNISSLPDLRNLSTYVTCDPTLSSRLLNMISVEKSVSCSYRNVRYYPDTFTVNINSRSKVCYVKEGNHKSIKAHFSIHLMTKEYSQHCFSFQCKNIAKAHTNNPQWPTWPIPKKYHSGIDDFLQSTSSTRMNGNLDIGKIHSEYEKVQKSIKYESVWQRIVSETSKKCELDWDNIECSDTESENESEMEIV